MSRLIILSRCDTALSCPKLLAVLLVLGFTFSLPATGQPTVVTPGTGFTLEVNGEPFYPLGWNLVGHCAQLPEERFITQHDSLAAELERIRSYGTNAVFETTSGDGRFIPYKVDDRHHNWYSYNFTDFDGRERQRGHIRPGIYVAALKRYMDLAYYGPDRTASAPIYTIASLDKYTVPEGDASPYGGSDTLRCESYRRFIQEEQSWHAAAGSEFAALIPPVSCEEQERYPFWEWNVRYIVQNLRNHPGLLGWFLWDEPEGVTWRHLFGIMPPDTPAPSYEGPKSLPTPDLLRHAYQLVIAAETEGQPPDYQRHPIMVDIYDGEAFFSDRFAWSREGSLQPKYHSGPFDRAPNGEFDVPADVLGQEASAFVVETAARGGEPLHGWYWDPNLISRRSAMLREVVERDGLWSTLIISGQGWVAHGGPYGLSEPLRCPMNERPRLSLLNDRDLLWHLLTPQINGLRGYLYYARAYTPYEGDGAEQVARTDRLLKQFREAELDHVLSAPVVEIGWTVESISISALTNYFRSDPDFVGPADSYDPGLSAFSAQNSPQDPSDYRADMFTRSATSNAYGHPVLRSEPLTSTTFGAHHLLRTTLHQYNGALYLFVSNAYDARITARIRFEDGLATTHLSLNEGQFNLDLDGGFEWVSSPDRLRTSQVVNAYMVALDLEPYEVRLFKLFP